MVQADKERCMAEHGTSQGESRDTEWRNQRSADNPALRRWLVANLFFYSMALVSLREKRDYLL